jgi:DNA-binding XRE family transcriptional regulator
VSWEIRLHPAVESWYLAICASDPETADLIKDAIDQLAEEGPIAGRPLVDRVQGSRYHNMKELRPPSSGTSEVRMLFAFDPAREAIFLVSGDKAGNWKRWYRQAIPLADERFRRALDRDEGERAMNIEYAKWSDVKAKARALDPRTETEREAGAAKARERREAYVRGHQLAEMRKAAGLTQAEVAEALGVSQTRVSKIEHGEVSGIDVVRSYVAALGGTIEMVASIGDRTWRVA